MLLVASLAPFFLGLASVIYLIGAAALGIWFLAESIRFSVRRTDELAKRLLLSSVIYLPLLFILLVLTKN
jgi:protoheme IX farnesyltransferase